MGPNLFRSHEEVGTVTSGALGDDSTYDHYFMQVSFPLNSRPPSYKILEEAKRK